MSFWEIVGVLVSAVAGSGLLGTGMALIVGKLKESKLVQNLHLESLLDSIGTTAVSYVESWARQISMSGTDKLNLARDAFQKELKRYGIKLDTGSIDKRIESVLNQLQASMRIEKPKEFETDEYGELVEIKKDKPKDGDGN